ncbi:MAG: transposase [Micrococcaceae bacterium]|nr:transposase [Micrococcaceae bacterium]
MVSGQDVEPAEGPDGTDGRWRIARKVAPDRLISTVDTQARHAHKTRQERRDGYKGHLIIEPDTGLVTAAKLTMATGPDSTDPAAGAALLGEDHSIGVSPVQVLADSAYGSASMLKSLAGSGHQALIKPKPLNRAIADGFTIDEFTYDPAANTLTCPNGLARTISAKGLLDLRCRMPGMPAAGPVHHLRKRTEDRSASRTRVDAGPPGRSGGSRVRCRLPASSADGRAFHCLDDSREPATTVSGHGKERCLVEATGRGSESETSPETRVTGANTGWTIV